MVPRPLSDYERWRGPVVEVSQYMMCQSRMSGKGTGMRLIRATSLWAQDSCHRGLVLSWVHSRLDGECGITQCCLCDTGAAALEEEEESYWQCRATGHGYRMGHVGLRVVRGCGRCGVESAVGCVRLRVVRGCG